MSPSHLPLDILVECCHTHPVHDLSGHALLFGCITDFQFTNIYTLLARIMSHFLPLARPYTQKQIKCKSTNILLPGPTNSFYCLIEGIFFSLCQFRSLSCFQLAWKLNLVFLKLLNNLVLYCVALYYNWHSTLKVTPKHVLTDISQIHTCIWEYVNFTDY